MINKIVLSNYNACFYFSCSLAEWNRRLTEPDKSLWLICLEARIRGGVSKMTNESFDCLIDFDKLAYFCVFVGVLCWIILVADDSECRRCMLKGFSEASCEWFFIVRSNWRDDEDSEGNLESELGFDVKSETERDDGFFTFELGIRFTGTLTGLTLLH